MQRKARAGERVEKIMVVTRKSWRESVNGRFLVFQLSDKDGPMKGVLWQVPDSVDREIGVNDIVRVVGEMKSYKDNLEMHIDRIERLKKGDYDQSLFLPSSTRPADLMYSEILETISGMQDEHLRLLLEAIFGDESFKADFIVSPAAKSWHHSYIGGLLEHTYDMMRMALKAAEIYREVNKDLLIAGVLLHDVGKLQELAVSNSIEYSDSGRLLGHITLGVEFVSEYIRGMDDFPDELGLRLKHMILSHHGALENGSPVLPMTVEALLLHYIDNLDAQVRGTLQALGKDNGSSGNWTDFVRLLDRYIYRGPDEEDGIGDK
ncbi:hypothetical protein DRQ05_01550 [bacterium]|nr:MAG: hypothetical protein DRQ05_01550 [bacterium]